MDKNELRTHFKIRLYRLWEEHISNHTEAYQTSIESWSTNWDGKCLRISQNETVVAKINLNNLYLSEDVSTRHHFPLKMLEQSMAQRCKLCYNSV